jgi:3-oxoadipate enol-lactonase
MAYVSSGGKKPVQIHYQVTGDSGPAVVLVHGLGLSSRFWFDMPETLANEPERPRRIIAIDNRGTGRSDRPLGLWTTGVMADDVARVLDHAKVDSACVVGVSMGGMIAQSLALRHPSRVRGLVLLVTTAGFLTGALPRVSAVAQLCSLPFRGRNAGRNLARLLLPESKLPRAREIFRHWPSAMHEERPVPKTFAAHLFAASTHFASPKLEKIACPAIVVAGKHDRLVPPRNSEVLARRIPGAELEVIDDASHGLFADDPDLVQRMLTRLEAKLERQ